MRTGDLTVRAQIQAKTVTKNAAQQLVESWPVIATRWANRVPVAGSERLLQGQVVAGVETVFTFRFDSVTRTIRPETHRLVEAGVVYDVKWADDVDGRKTWWTVQATRLVS